MYIISSRKKVRIFVVQHQIRILMMFVLAVVLEVVRTMMFTVPSFNHQSLISFGGRLEEFLDSWCDLMVHEQVEKRIIILRRRKFP
jgi:hypothetical protein